MSIDTTTSRLRVKTVGLYRAIPKLEFSVKEKSRYSHNAGVFLVHNFSYSTSLRYLFIGVTLEKELFVSLLC